MDRISKFYFPKHNSTCRTKVIMVNVMLEHGTDIYTCELHHVIHW
jgi:hypothetical protein